MSDHLRQEREAVFKGLGLLASCFEYTLLVGSFIVGSNGGSGVPANQGDVITIALLSIFSTSFSAIVSLFEDSDLYNPLVTSTLFRRMAKVAIGFDSLALVASFGLLVFSGQMGQMLVDLWFGCAIALSLLLLPRFVLSIVLFLSALISLGLHRQSAQENPCSIVSYAEKRNEDAFDYLWDRVVHPIMLDIAGEYPGIQIVENVKVRIWRSYCELNNHASIQYMNDPSARMDRHKVSACHALAILKVVPFVVDYNKVQEGSRASFCNERLALRVCCSVLATFLVEAFSEVSDEKLSPDERGRALDRLHQGVHFPETVGHGGSYVQCVLRSFRFARLESRFDIPLLSLLAFDWESWLINEDLHRIIIDCYSRGAFADNGKQEADDNDHDAP